MTAPVSFPLAKLLKEKGFDEEVLFYYLDSVLKQHPLNKLYNWNLDNPPLNQFSAPTIAEVVMWMYEKHGIWISVDFNLETSWFYDIVVLSEEGGNILDNFDSPTEAYEAAIDYILNNLI